MYTHPGSDETKMPGCLPSYTEAHRHTLLLDSSPMTHRPVVLRFLLAKDRCLIPFTASEMKVLPSLVSTRVRAAYFFRE